MGLADFRYNAFNNAMEPINITDEVHNVPTNAPHNIQLSEVPSKDNPSSVVVKYLDVRDGDALIEVGAPPGAGQFWCDYNTENPSWNTGTIRFNAADAGKAIKVNYKGTGTLAGVKSSRLIAWQNARGCGLLGDKVCSNGEVFQGTYQYRNFIVPTGVTVYIELSAVIMCTGSCTVLGAINGVGRGAWGTGVYGGTGGKAGESRFASGDGGSAQAGYNCTYGEQVLVYTGSPTAYAVNLFSYLNVAVFFGAAGGTGAHAQAAGGRGGAGLKIVATSFLNKGTINLSGGNGGNGAYISTGKYSGGGGGGGGGALFVAASRIGNAGEINVNAGAGGAWGGSGSGGTSYPGNPGYPGFIHLAEVMP